MPTSQQKKTWSLQDNKRTEAERNLFKATGKPKKSKNVVYLLSVIGGLLVLSFLLPQFYEKAVTVCVTDTFCVNSKTDVLLFTLYVFFTIVILILAVYGAYVVGKKLANAIKL
ncbi:hypothetical protein [Olleya sp. YS]|uniref:hypothetical protein n=1 Tax=Olleya sp. YS TaxID=3028318 RepID=UPI0024343CDF|nr:hypothetical protein [Olleya sp. YS]WGD35186.1 hypothetical protein Ollyesu_01940 [Olleya sp. YS]